MLACWRTDKSQDSHRQILSKFSHLVPLIIFGHLSLYIAGTGNWDFENETREGICGNWWRASRTACSETRISRRPRARSLADQQANYEKVNCHVRATRRDSTIDTPETRKGIILRTVLAKCTYGTSRHIYDTYVFIQCKCIYVCTHAPMFKRRNSVRPRTLGISQLRNFSFLRLKNK